MPANETYSWNQKTLNIVFALSSVVMLLSVILMMQKDQDDEWRPIQRKNFQLEAELREVELSAIESDDFKAKKAELQQKIAAADVALKQVKTEATNEELFSLLDRQQREVDRLGEVLKSLNGLRDEARAKFDLAVSVGLPEADISQKMAGFKTRQGLCDETRALLDTANEAARNHSCRDESDHARA